MSGERLIILTRRGSGERLWPIFDSEPGERVTVLFSSEDAAQRFAYARLLDGDWAPEELSGVAVKEWIEGCRRAHVTHVLIEPDADEDDHDAAPIDDLAEELLGGQ